MWQPAYSIYHSNIVSRNNNPHTPGHSHTSRHPILQWGHTTSPHSSMRTLPLLARPANRHITPCTCIAEQQHFVCSEPGRSCNNYNITLLYWQLPLMLNQYSAIITSPGPFTYPQTPNYPQSSAFYSCLQHASYPRLEFALCNMKTETEF